MGELASALEGVMEALARMLGDIYAVIGGAAEYRKKIGKPVQGR